MKELLLSEAEKRIGFLKEYHLYHQYITNELMARQIEKLEWNENIEILASVFDWGDTPEGRNFWNYIDDRIDEIYSK